MGPPDLCWVDGELLPIDAPAIPAGDSAFGLGVGCYSTARIVGGRPRFGDRHAARLVRDARRLGLGEVDPRRVVAALCETGSACFGSGADGIVRVQASRGGGAGPRLVALPRETGPEPDTWTACTSPFVHEGPMPWSGAKVTNHLLFVLAGVDARQRDADEALLLDREGYLVEGSRSNVVLVLAGGEVVTPDLARGGVRGVGLEVLCARGAEIRVRHVSALDLERAREIVTVNAVRGPRAVLALDGRGLGEAPGPVARALAECFATD